MSLKKKILLLVVSLLLLGMGYNIWYLHQMQQPKYEVGAHSGAAVCKQCHLEIYEQWQQNSAHAVATTRHTFLTHMQNGFSQPMIAFMMDESMCYACHGNKQINEGVNCETCHGLAPPDVPIEVTHANKYKPGMARYQAEDFCMPCHTVKAMPSGDLIFSVYYDWKQTAAAKQGITCQQCHLKPRTPGAKSYHGFDSILRRDAELYKDDLFIRNVTLAFPELQLEIENKVLGHNTPTAGPFRFLYLEIALLNEQGETIHQLSQRFGKFFAVVPVMGFFPDRQIDNTQLLPGETRQLHFQLPQALKDRVKRAKYRLRFYDVADEYQGDASKAHWFSEPIIENEIILVAGDKK